MKKITKYPKLTQA